MDPTEEDLAVEASMAEARDTAMRLNLQTAGNPDEEARIRRLAAETGVPLESARGQEAFLRNLQATREIIGTAQGKPATQRFLADPDKAAIATDDVDTLTGIEDLFGLGRGQFVQPKYFGASPGAPAPGKPLLRFERKAPGATLSAPLPVPDTWQQWVAGIWQDSVSAAVEVDAGLRMQYQDLRDALGLGALDRQTGEVQSQDLLLYRRRGAGYARELSTPEIEDDTKRGVYGGLTSLARTGPGIAASIATGNPLPAFLSMGVNTQADAYGKYRERGGTPGEAFLGATGEAAVEIGTELLPTGKMLGAFGKTGEGAIKDFLLGLGLDIPGEQIATFVQDAIDTAIANPDKTWADFAAERPDAAYQTLVATLTQGGIMSALNTTAGMLNRQEVRAAEGEKTAGVLEELDKLAAVSPLRERDPAAFEAFVADVVADGVDSVYVDAKTFAQAAANATPEEQAILEGMASMAGLAEAAELGLDLKVPVAEFAARLAGTSLAPAIIENGRANPFELSRAQAKVAREVQGEELQAEAEKVLASSKVDEAFRASAKVVEDQIVTQLAAVNRFSNDVNKAYAKAHAAFYVVQAARWGVTPEEMAQRYPLRITAQEAPGSNPLRQNLPTLKAPPTSPSGKVRLLHWGKKGKVARLDPKKWGGNSDVLTRAERMMADDDRHPGRVYFGIGVGQPGGYTPEFGLGEHLYGAEVDIKDLYDYDADPLGLRAGRVKEMLADEGFDAEPEPGMPDFGYYDEAALLYDLAIREAGYKGFWTAEQGSGLIGVSFEKVKAEYQGKNDGQAFYQRAVPAARLEGAPETNEPYAPARQAAVDYMRQVGLQFAPPTVYVKVDTARAKRIADAFEAMEHAPSDPQVAAAYQALIEETRAQWEVIKATGLIVEFIDFAKTGDPYAESPRAAIADVRENNHLWVFPTDDGFGETLLNVGLDTNDGAGITRDEVLSALRDIGANVLSDTQHRSGTEETAVIRLANPLTPAQAEKLSTTLKQEAIAQLAGGVGELYGPAAEKWKPFNPDFFMKLTGDKLTPGDMLSDNPLLALTDVFIGDKQLRANDLFRIVHDYFGHIKDGNGFRAGGEENAWQSHAAMYTPLARRAATTETRGQNSWVNYGPHGETNRKASAADTVYADQKVGLLPAWASEDGFAGGANSGLPLGGEALFAQSGKKAQELAKTIPGLKKTLRYLKDDEKAKLRKNTAAKMMQIINDLPSAEEMASVAFSGRAKKGWYENSANALLEVFGLQDATRFAALLAALSPQVSVESNLFNALSVWTAWDKAGRPTDKREIVDLMGASVQGKGTVESVLGAWINNSVTALTTENPGEITLSGPKVNSFMLNLVGVVDEVTNDAWMANYALVEQSLFRKTGPTPGKGAGYTAMNALVRKAAEIVSKRTGETWTPAEVQETVWSWAKTLYEARDAANVNATTKDILAAGGLTHEDIGATPDFALLFLNGIYSTILKEGGYGDKLENLGSRGRAARAAGSVGDATGSEGSGVPDATFRKHLEQAAERLEQLRTQRAQRAQEAERTRVETAALKNSDPNQLRLFMQSDSQPIFYSALARAVEASPTKRAPAAQWKATLAKTPGVKREEIEWTGVEEWLDLQEGVVERDDLQTFLADNGVQLEEVLQQSLQINQRSEYLFPAVEKAVAGAKDYNDLVLQLENDGAAYRILSKQDGLLDEDGNLREDWANVVADDLLAGDVAEVNPAQFADYKLPGADDTYKELLITLPKIGGPSTHWDVDNVVAHARVTERKSADGKRVLFLEEVQSDWHQKGRDQGYQGTATQEEIFAAERAQTLAASERGDAKDAYISAVREAVYAKADMLDRLSKEHFFKETGRYPTDGEEHPMVDQVAEMRSRVGAGLSVATARIYLNKYNIEISDTIKDADSRYSVAQLRLEERMQTVDALRGSIPDAPFRKSWSTLVMKRMIRYAVDNGFEQVAWINGNQQNGGTTGGDGSFFYERNLVNTTNDLIKKYGAKVEQTVRLKGINTETQPSPEFAIASAALQKANDSLRALSVRDPQNGEAELTRRAEELRSAVPPENFSEQDKAEVAQRYLATADALEAGLPLIQKWRDAVEAYKAAEPTSKVFQIPANFGFTITPELTAASQAGMPLFQNGEDRGSFDPNTNTINLLRRADLSTFLHETGHFYLNVLADMASRPDAPAEVVADMETTLRWFGVPNLQTWLSMSLDEQRPHHEKWARGYEAYLFEGKAPNLGMRELFAKFSAWMKLVYKSLTELNVELDDEVRGVFNRLLATSEEIAAAEDARSFLPIFQSKPEGMTDDEWVDYQRLGQQATADAASELQTRSLRDMKWLSNAKSRALRELQKGALVKRKNVRDEVTAEVQAEPVYRALAYLKRGEIDGVPTEGARKLSIQGLKDQFAGVAPELQDWTQLGYGKYGMLAENGMTPDEAADLLGFDTGAELVNALLNAEPIGEKIAGLTDQRMLERYGDLTDPASMARAAEEAVHNEARIRFVATELNALAKAVGKPSILNAAVKEYAAGIIARLPIKELRPHRYTAAALRAAKASEKALAKGNRLEAVTEKRNQLINLQAARGAWDARTEVEKGMALFARIAKAKDDNLSKSRNMDLVNAARAIMAAYGVGRSKNDPAGYMQALKRYDPSLYADLEPFIEAATARPKPIAELTYEEFIGLRDTVNQLWVLARRSKVIEIDGKQVEIDTAAGEMGARLDEIGVPPRDLDRAPTDGERRLRQLSGLRAATRRVEHWAKLLGKPFTKYIWQPVSEAADAYRLEKPVYFQKFLSLLEPIQDTLKPVKIGAAEIGYTFSGKSELLHAILHTGNLSNKTKLLVGRGWGTLTPDGVLNDTRWQALVDRLHAEGVLTKADYDFAQGVWDLLEETKPLAQRAHHAMYGRYFAEVTADEVVTPFGSYRGGYVPALTDAFLVQDAALRADSEAVEGGDHSMFPSPTKGFTKSRVENYNRELALDLRLLPQHIDKVLKFSHLGPPVRDVLRLLKAKGFSTKLEKFDPVAQTELLLPWLNRAVRQRVSTPMTGEAGRMADSFFRTLRQRTGLGIMFGNLVNSLQQLTGFTAAMIKVKPYYLRAGVFNYLRNPTQLAENIAQVSPFMSERLASQTFEINQAIDDIVLDPNGFDKTRDFFNRHGYFLQHAFQNTVDLVTWQGAYEQATAEGLLGKDAVRAADAAVRQSQGAMNAEDLARIEAGNAIFRLFTQFSTYFNNLANLLGTEFSGTLRDAGFKGAPRLAYVYFMGFAAPALLADLIVRVMRGEGDDEDDGWMDEFLDWFFGAQFRTGMAMIPVAGSSVASVFNTFNDKPYDDRIANSPVISTLESAARAPKSVYSAATGDGSTKRAVKDTLSAVALATGLPVTVLGKPVGYAIDVAEGKTKPTGPVDAVRGAVSGKGPPPSF